MVNSLHEMFLFNHDKKMLLKQPKPKIRSIKKKPGNKKRQARRNSREPSFEINWNKNWVLGLLVFAVVAAVPFMLPNEQWLPIEKINLSGDFRQLDINTIGNQLEAYQGNSFLSVDIQAIQKNVARQPWVKSVSVRRIWPNQLQVTFQEKVAVARWDKNHLLSNQAVIFKADSRAFNHLPLINGYSGQTQALLQRFGEMQKSFARHGISISEMREDSKGALSLVMNKQLRVRLGSEKNDVKIRNFLAVYQQQIKPRANNIKHIDFRYSNGFAIGWRKEYLQQIQGQSDTRGNKNV